MKNNTGMGRVGLVVLVLFLLAVPFTAYLLTQRTSFFNKAASVTPIRNLAGDLWADKVIGQPDFAQGIPGEVTSFTGANPAGVLVDRSHTPNRVYVFDGINSRILGYRSLGVCSNDTSKECTSKAECGGSACNIQVAGKNGQKRADIVIGQTAFNTSACNGDGTWQSKPDFPLPSARTLCSTLPSEPSAAEAHPGASMAVDSAGKLYVADFYNNRVLVYNDPFVSPVANDVWGQPDFNSHLCNRGQAINGTGFCFINHAPTKPEVGGVDIDPQGNLWVVDGGNNRVLRFPHNGSGVISKTPDVVLGQPNFTSGGWGNSLASLNAPSAVRVNQAGTVFVADSENGRILAYDAPLTNGKAARVFNDKAKKVTGLDIDQNGNIWANETDNNQLVQYSPSGTPLKVLFKDTYRPDSSCGGAVCISPLGRDSCNMCGSKGSIGITANGDILTSSANFSQTVNYYNAPIPNPTPGYAYAASHQFFSPPIANRNLVSQKSLQSPRGIAITPSQLVVADSQRVMFYNVQPPANLPNGAQASGILNASAFDQLADPHYQRIASSKNNLWVLRENELTRYTLPLTNGQRPAQTIRLSDMPLLGSQTPITNETLATGIYADPDDRYLWLSLPYQSRVARVRVPQNFTGPYVIDALIGGSNVPAKNMTWHRACPDLNTLCAPGSVTEDRNGNIYVSDYYLENEGTGRLIRFSKSSFPLNNTSLITKLVPDAAKTFRSVYGWEPAFDSLNNAFIGHAAFTTNQGQTRKYGQLDSITGDILPAGQILNDHFAQAYSLKFDQNNNLFATDMNHGRILIFNNPSNIGPTSSVSATPTPVISPTPWPTVTGNLLLNSSFEIGLDNTGGAWLRQNTENADRRQEAADARSGSRVFRFAPDSLTTWEALVQTVNYTGKANDGITFTIDSRAPEALNGKIGAVIVLQNTPSGTTKNSVTFPTPSSWRQNRMTIKTTSPYTSIKVYLFNQAKSFTKKASYYYLDDAKLVVQPNAPSTFVQTPSSLTAAELQKFN